MIVVLDYGMGNLQSVRNAFEALEVSVKLTSLPSDLRDAHAVVLPGVGAFGDGIQNLTRLGLIEALNEEVLVKKKPYLGICLGMQFLAQESYEGGRYKGFGWLPATVKRIEPAEKKFKVPHMGWNDVRVAKADELFAGLPDGSVFYFVHSYRLEVDDGASGAVTSTCWHGTTIPASVQLENVYGVQFHPEKSQQAGLQLLKNFLHLAAQW